MSIQFEGILARPRLLSQLTDGSRPSVIVFSAPPGYGKTILARQYVDGLTHPVMWHTLHPDEQDVTNLYHAALHRLPVGAVDAAELPSAFERSPIELARDITTRLSETFGESPFCYVLDDWHHAAGHDGDAWLRALVEGLPTQGQLLILSRSLPHLDYVHLLARSAVTRINQAELRFTAEEVAQLGALHHADPQTIAPHLAPLEGWPVGVVMALKRDGHPPLVSIPGDDIDPDRLFNRLAATMFQNLDPSFQTFLLVSSTLEAMTPLACRQGLGLSGVVAALDQLRQRALFVVETPAGLVYHALFRAFLQDFARQLDPPQFLARHRQAAAWFEGQGQMTQAFAHYMTGEAYDQAAVLADAVAPIYFSQGKFQTLLSWESSLAAQGVTAPHLTYECTIIHYDAYDYDQARLGLRAAEAEFIRRNDQPGLANVDIQRAWIACQTGANQEGLDQVQPFLEAERLDTRAHALRVAGVASLRLLRSDDGVRYLQEAEGLFRQLGLKSSLSHTLQDLGAAHSNLGQMAQAERCLHEVVALRRELGGRGALAWALNNLGYYYHQHNGYHRARAIFREGLSLAAEVDSRRAGIYLAWSLGDLERDLESWESALAYYHQGLRISSTHEEPAVVASLYTSLSALYRRQGRYQAARTAARQALEQHLDSGLETLRARANYHLAQVGEQAIPEILTALQSILEELKSHGEHFERSGLLAAGAGLALDLADEIALETFVQPMLEAVIACRTGQAAAAEIRARPALRDRLAQQIQTPPLVEALDALDAAATAAAARSATSRLQVGSTFSLYVKTLGVLRIERNGALVHPRAWGSHTSLDLFLYILVRGPQTKEALSLTFWPDGHGRRLHSQFHTELNRARQAVGKDTIQHHEGQYRINPDFEVTLDFELFEATVQQARLMPDKRARAEDLWRAALQHYQGPFLPEVASNWVLAYREHFESQALDVYDHLARLALARQSYDEALAHWHSALDIDPYQERFVRAMMQAHIHQGETAQALRLYHRFRQTVLEAFGSEPAPETQHLYQQILQS